MNPDFARFASYAATTLDNSADATWLGRAFGQLPAELVRQVVSQPVESHGGGRTIHAGVASGCLGQSFRDWGESWTWPPRSWTGKRQKPSRRSKWHRRKKPLNAVKQAVTEAKKAYLAALAPLTPAERSELQQGLYPVLTEQNQVGHTLSDRASGRHLLDLLEKMDRSSMYAAARALDALDRRAIVGATPQIARRRQRHCGRRYRDHCAKGSAPRRATSSSAARARTSTNWTRCPASARSSTWAETTSTGREPFHPTGRCWW